MNATKVVSQVRVEVAETGVVGHAGLHLLGDMADRLGLADLLGGVICQDGERPPGHDRGRMFCQVLLGLAGGASSAADMRVLENQPDLFGLVASQPMFWRLFNRECDATAPAAIAAAMADGRAQLWTDGQAPDEVVLDLDATLVDVHSENKEGAAATFKGGFGFAPMLCFLDGTGEPLAGMLRPGNATVNAATDQLSVIDAAVAVLPETYQVGHREGDDTGDVGHRILVRTDSAGHVKAFLDGLTSRNIEFSVTGRYNPDVADAIAEIDPDTWLPARTLDGEKHTGACVAEIDVVPAGLPAGTRVIVRREKTHPGDCVTLEAHHRTHARVENHIKALKDSGLERFPYTAWAANEAWFACVLAARMLTCWLQHHILDGDLTTATPATLRYRLLHMPARIVSHARRLRLRLDRAWPWTPAALAGYERLDRLLTT